MGNSLATLEYKKANDFIAAKFNSKGLENQLMAIGITRLQEVYDDCGLMGFKAEIYPGELKQLIKSDDHIYRNLKIVASKMTGRNICIEDGNGNFTSFSLIPNAKYENGVFTFMFNEQIKPYLYQLKNNYTTLQLSMVLDLKDWAFRIYEILKKDLFLLDKNNAESCKIEYRLSEFRFMIGAANMHHKSIQGLIKTDPDWDAVYDLLPDSEKKYIRTNDLKQCILEPAQKELKEKSDLSFDYKLVREGKTYKKIQFTIRKQEIERTETMLKKENIIKKGAIQYEFPYELAEYQDYYDKYEGDNDFRFSREDLKLLIAKAQGNKALASRAIELARKQPSLTNAMGWIITCIKNGGYEDMPTINGSVDVAQQINNFQQNYEADRAKGKIQKDLWEKIMKRDTFSDFEDFLVDNYTIDAQLLVEEYGYDKACKVFLDWNRGKEVTL